VSAIARRRGERAGDAGRSTGSGATPDSVLQQLRMTGNTCSFTPSRPSSGRDVRSAGYRSCRCRWGGIDRRIVWSVDVQLTGRSLARVLTYRSLPPMPPGRDEAKYSVLPVADNAGIISAAGEFTVVPRFSGVDQGSDT
jgi:hypothetical protein